MRIEQKNNSQVFKHMFARPDLVPWEERHTIGIFMGQRNHFQNDNVRGSFSVEEFILYTQKLFLSEVITLQLLNKLAFSLTSWGSPLYGM